MSTSTTALPLRPGPRPQTTTQIPHTQVDQQPEDDRFLTALLAQAATWPSVARAESRISVAGAAALVLDHVVVGPSEAFLVGGEFAHGHAGGDSSLHVALPVPLATAAEQAGWAEPHFLVHQGILPPNIVMLYAPRDEEEARVLLALVRSSYEFALTTAPTSSLQPTIPTRSAP
ncbi:MAG: hypothetical protein JWP74_2920 [Marmoricola sp.]|nr:hypothetical protein [Marmoricola sp.]